MGGAGLALAANRAVAAAAGPKARFFMVVSGPADGPEAQSWRKLVGELEKRGFPTTLVQTIYPNGSFTPNETRARHDCRRPRGGDGARGHPRGF